MRSLKSELPPRRGANSYETLDIPTSIAWSAFCQSIREFARSIEYFPQDVSLKLRHPSRAVPDRILILLAGGFSRDRDESGEPEYFVALRVPGAVFHPIKFLPS